MRSRYSDVSWGITGCSRGGCYRLAELHAEGWGQLCVPCADELLERQAAIGAAPVLRELLPGWDDN